MKLIRKPATASPPQVPRAAPWKLLVVDDEPDVRQLTVLNLRGFQFAGRHLQLIEAASAAEARQRLAEHPDIAAALIDVVMETDDAGLKLVEYIRNALGNAMMRLVIRTGQPGVAPERYVIDNFDIDDYKDKTELTVQKLYTTVRSALKGYRDLQTIQINRIGLEHILDVTPELYNLHKAGLEEYFRGVMTQIIGLCKLGHTGMISTIDGMVVTLDGRELHIQAGAGDLDLDHDGHDARRREIAEICSEVVLTGVEPERLRAGSLVVPLQVKDRVFGFVYLESAERLSEADGELIRIMANQCAAALENYRLHHSIEESYDNAIEMLGQVAEFKDNTTGTHIRRIESYTQMVALEMGFDRIAADAIGKASRLHDVGKVGIPDAILRKPGKLDADEFAVIKRHAAIGNMVLGRHPAFDLARRIAYMHHERWDGGGYPQGLAGEAIPLEARIAAVVDVFDALVNERPYKRSWQIADAIGEIERCAGSHFDPRVVEAFLRLYRAGAFAAVIAEGRGE
jgi:HD-GYP domain-containing protein (c-di-GMP phosphodiesterase class II)/CheY-like chemotaxis protein